MLDLGRLFSDIVQLKIGLWNAIEGRLKSDFGLPLAHFELMSAMDRLAVCRVHDIAHELSLTAGGASKQVDRLVTTGYCRRLPNPADRRSSLVELTAEGQRVLAQAGATLDEELRSRLGAAVTERALRQFATTLERLRAGLQEDPASRLRKA